MIDKKEIDEAKEEIKDLHKFYERSDYTSPEKGRGWSFRAMNALQTALKVFEVYEKLSTKEKIRWEMYTKDYYKIKEQTEKYKEALEKIKNKKKSLTHEDKGHFCEAKKELQGAVDIAKSALEIK